MDSDAETLTPAQSLHDRFTRGETLPEVELAALHAWYAEQDEEEARLLEHSESPQSLSQLQEKVREAEAQLLVEPDRLAEVLARNEHLRQRISALQGQLEQRILLRAS